MEESYICICICNVFVFEFDCNFRKSVELLCIQSARRWTGLNDRVMAKLGRKLHLCAFPFVLFKVFLLSYSKYLEYPKVYIWFHSEYSEYPKMFHLSTFLLKVLRVPQLKYSTFLISSFPFSFSLFTFSPFPFSLFPFPHFWIFWFANILQYHFFRHRAGHRVCDYHSIWLWQHVTHPVCDCHIVWLSH